jgi:hypothetical protein
MLGASELCAPLPAAAREIFGPGGAEECARGRSLEVGTAFRGAVGRQERIDQLLCGWPRWTRVTSGSTWIGRPQRLGSNKISNRPWNWSFVIGGLYQMAKEKLQTSATRNDR